MTAIVGMRLSSEQGIGESVSLKGWNRRSTTKSPAYLKRLLEAATIFKEAMDGDPYASIHLREAFSTSDFPILFGDVLSRELLPAYQATPTLWQSFARRTVVRDFRPHKFVDLIGGRGILDVVPELTEYPARTKSELEYELLVRKTGGRFALSWEALINDDLNGLSTLPQDLALAARRSEDYLAASLLTDGDGPNAAFFSNTVDDDHPYDNLTDLPLTSENLESVIQTIQSRTDSDDLPVIVDGFVLVVPPSLEITAQRIINATELRYTDADTGATLITGNWLNGRVTLVVNPWLAAVDKGADAATTWYVLPQPSSPRPALVLGFLRGYEQPDLRVRSSDSQRIGGGDVPAEEGSFDNDDIQYRVRHVNGGTTLDTIATMASTGDAA